MRSKAQGRRLPPLAGIVLTGIVLTGIAFTGGCKPGVRTAPSPADAATPPGADWRATIARAEDTRRAQDVPAEAQRDHDVTLRRFAARAFARILDADDGPLLRALDDDDPEVAEWGAYGLGETCRGRVDAHVRALAARLVSLQGSLQGPGATHAVDVALRALGRCGGDAAEQTLRAW